MLFGEALTKLQTRKAEGMRLPKWSEDVVIKLQYPDEKSKMTHPYLYVESRFGCVPWKETVVEMFDDGWILINEIKEPKCEEKVLSEVDILKNEIFNCLTWYTNRIAETIEYSSWSDNFCRKKIKEYNEVLMVNLEKLIDWDNLTADVMKLLRFQIWTSKEEVEEEIKNIMDSLELSNEEKTERLEKLKKTADIRLIPLYLLPIIPKGIELVSITGESIIYNGDNIDTDTRFGCIAYGLHSKEEKNA